MPWDGKDGSGRDLSPGVYFMRVRAAGSTRTEKFVLGP
jgi:hypothetical protein